MPQSKQRALSREIILSTALGLVDEEGLSALSLRSLGKRLGVSQAAFYRHFPDKAALLEGISEQVWRLTFEAFLARSQAGEAGAGVPPLRRLLTANAIPMAIEENWIPAALLPNLLRTSPNFSVYAELTSADLAPQWGEDMIEAHAATAQEAALLSVPEGAPTLDITRRTFHEHCAIDYSRTLFRADRYTLWVPVAAPKPAFRPDRSSS